MPAQPLSLLLLGSLEISLDGQPVKFRTTKAQALLIFLCAETALHPTVAIRREALLALLWPDYPERSARQSLRTNLSYLRKAIPELQARTEDSRAPFLLSDNQGVQPNPAVHYELDLATFSLLLDQCRKHEHDDLLTCSECQERLQQATELYRGDFAADFYLPDSSQFEEWVLARRAELRRQALDALATLTEFGIKGGDFDYAEGYARRQLEIDNLRESAHRQLMETLARNGRRRAALSHFETMQQLLAGEMGLAPSAETEALVEAIRSGDLTQPVRAARPATAASATPGAQLPAFLGEDTAVPAPENAIFVGRKQVLARLDSHVEEMVAGHGRVVFVTGEAGQGKSTLLHEMARRAGEDHPDLIAATGNCNAYAGVGDPYSPFREVMGLLTGDVESRLAAGVISHEQALRLWRLLPDTVQSIIKDGPDLIDVFVSGTALIDRATAAMAGGADWLGQLKELAERTSGASTGRLEQRHLFDQYAAVLGSLATRQPLLITLDDLQWADEASISLLFHLGRRLESSRILILGAYRPDEVALGRDGERHPLEKVLGEFKRVFGDVWLDLAEAERKEGRAFIDVLLDSEPNRLDRVFRQTLFEQTGGHPLFTVELLRTMQERGDLVQDAQGRWVEGTALEWLALPARVEGAIEERIGRLAPELRELLTVASVEGELFTAEVLAQVQGMEQWALLRRLSQELEKRHRLVRERGMVSVGGQQLSRYRFGHILIQRYLYDDLSPGERRLLHRAIAQVLAKLYEAEPDEIAAQLARHLLKAGEPERAVVHLVRSGDRARRLAALDEASRFYREALEYWPEADRSGRAQTLRKFGECLWIIGSRQEALGAYKESYALFEALGDLEGSGTIHRLIGRYKWEDASWEEALEHYRQSLAMLEHLPESVELARTTSGLSLMYMLKAEYDQALIWGERALELAERLGADDVTVHTLNNVGVSYIALGQAERGLKMLQESLDRALALGLPFDAGRAQNNLAILLLRLCRHGEVRAMLEDMEAHAVRYHVRIAVDGHLQTSAELDWLTGQWGGAATYIKSLSDMIEDDQSHNVAKIFASGVLGQMYNALGQAQAASEVLERLRPTVRRASQPNPSGLYLGQLARAYAILGLDSETKAVLDEFLDVIDRPSNANTHITRPLLFACQWLATRPAAGVLDDAQACLRRLERWDAQIGSPETAACLSEARGSVALAAGDPHEAVEHLRDAAGRWEAVGLPYDHARALNYLGQARLEASDTEGARVAFEQALAIVDHLAGQLSEEALKSSFLNSTLVLEIRAGLAKS